jgi:putative ABC transport system ATP-binding protein
VATGVDRPERKRRSQELLAEVGLRGRLGHLPSELSAGERQRVAVARALANAPRLLLADEPTGALDSAVGSRVLELVARMRERHGMTVIIASHDPTVSARADRVVELVDGRLAPPRD